MIPTEIFMFGLLNAFLFGVLCGYLVWGRGPNLGSAWDVWRETYRLRALRHLKEEQRLLDEEGVTDEPRGS